jgi:hypothetical protein
MKNSLLVVTLSALFGLLSISANASEVCSEEESAPLPDCVKVLYRGGGKIKLQNYCDYDVDVKVDRAVDYDDRVYLKAHHEKTIVSRLVVDFACCWNTTPECPH